ncbi:MAG: beta-glucuronidase, partial [Phocaeicola sp.]
TNNEIVQAAIEVSHFGKSTLTNSRTLFTIKDEFGKVYHQGSLMAKDIHIGSGINLGEVSYSLSNINTPMKLNLEVRLEGTECVNDWDFWVYPKEVELLEGDVYIADTLDTKAIEILQNGGKVLLTAAGKISYGKGIVQQFTPVFWNTSWFKMRPPHTTGIWVNNYHPVFKEFPTEYHSNLQWWELLNQSQVMLFSNFAPQFEPLVQSIDTWFLSRKIGTLFEANVLNGRLMVCSMDISSDLEKRVVARQMRKSILDYMNSTAFRPHHNVNEKQIEDLFTLTTPEVNLFTKQSPQELIPRGNANKKIEVAK